MAGVAKWLRQWIVVPPFAGSSPVVRPQIWIDEFQNLENHVGAIWYFVHYHNSSLLFYD